MLPISPGFGPFCKFWWSSDFLCFDAVFFSFGSCFEKKWNEFVGSRRLRKMHSVQHSWAQGFLPNYSISLGCGGLLFFLSHKRIGCRMRALMKFSCVRAEISDVRDFHWRSYRTITWNLLRRGKLLRRFLQKTLSADFPHFFRQPKSVHPHRLWCDLLKWVGGAHIFICLL